jgi:preprotein translocase subunit SecG
METIVMVVHVLLSVGLIGLVLIQHGKGADMGAAFGSGASATVFGARGSASFLTKLTTWLAVAFFVTSLALFYLASQRSDGIGSVTDSLPAAVEGATPAAAEPAPVVPLANEKEEAAQDAPAPADVPAIKQ